MATSVKASTVSPLIEHRETRNGRTTVTLSHRENVYSDLATKPSDGAISTRPAGVKAPLDHKASVRASDHSAKPQAEQTDKYKTNVRVRKASTRVDHELARTKDRSRRAEVANGIHNLVDPSRSVLRLGAHVNVEKLLLALALSHFKVDTHEVFLEHGFKFETSLEASVDGVHISHGDGRLELKWGDNTLASVNVDRVFDHFAQFLEDADATRKQVKDALSGTLKLPGGVTLSTSSTDGLSVTVSSRGITTTIGLKFPDTYYVSTEVDKPLTPRPPLSSVDVHIKATVELTPEQTAKENPQENKKATPAGVREVTPKGQPDYKTVLPTGGTTSLGPSAGGGEGIVGLGHRTIRLGIGGRARDAVIAIAAEVNHGDVSMGPKGAG